MSYRKFKFISPGIFITEIDNSQLPALPRDVGPAIVGRLSQGPALKPVQVNSFAEFIDIFGKPVPGGSGGDVWRYGNFTAPTYAAYAAQAWLRNNSPATMVRLLGKTHTDATAKTGYAGWSTENDTSNASAGSNGGAFGLFVCEGNGVNDIVSSSTDLAGQQWVSGTLSGTLAAIWYLQQGAIALSGQTVDTTGTKFNKGFATFFRAVDSGPTFKAVIQDGSGNTIVDSSFDFNTDSPQFVRKVFNTDPTLTNVELASNASSSYWLGESFEGNVKTFRGTAASGEATGVSGSVATSCYGIILRLATPDGSTADGGDFRMGPTKSPDGQFAKTGWFISQDIGGNTGSYAADNMQKLFRLSARELGEEGHLGTQKILMVALQWRLEK